MNPAVPSSALEDRFNPMDSFHLTFHRFDQFSHPCNLNVSETEVKSTKEVLQYQSREVRRNLQGLSMWLHVQYLSTVAQVTAPAAVCPPYFRFRDKRKVAEQCDIFRAVIML